MIFGFDEFELDVERLELLRSGKVVRAEALVLRLLAALVQRAGRVVTKEELIEDAWDGRAVSDNVVTVSMARLRKTLGDRRGEREFVVTVHRRGYRFARDVVAREARAAAALPRSAAPAGPPFVGREPVLARLHQAMDAARAGRGRGCVLLGEPGIGKTRVVEAFEREIPASQQRVVWGYCREAGDTPPLWPWLRLLRELIGVTVPPELERKLGSLASEVRGLLQAPPAHELRPDALRLEQVVAGAARHRALDALLYALTLTAEQTPCVLVLDDLHRADSASLELLGLLLDEIARTRILVIATLRSSKGAGAPRPDTPLPLVLGHRNCERIALEPLQADEVARYVSQVADDADGSLGRAVYAKSEGNPFFMTELLRGVEGGRPDPARLALPHSALELVRARLARLPEPTRNVLAAAAVIGRSFELPVLSAVVGLDSGALMACLDDALSAEILVGVKGSMTAFAFGHELLRAVLYDALSAGERRRWHLTVGQALELRVREGESVQPSELAYHFHAALPEGDLRKTVNHCRAAALASGAVFANTDVVRYARHAIEALDLIENASQRLRSALLMLIAFYSRGHAAAEFGRAIREVTRLAAERGDAAMLVRAAMMFNQQPGYQPLSSANAQLERALALCAPEDAATRAIALASLACTAPRCFSAEESDRLMKEAEASARSQQAGDDPLALRVVIRFKLYLHGGPAHGDAVARLEDEFEQLGQRQQVRTPLVPIELALHRALIGLQQGDAATIAANLARASASSRTLRHYELLWHSERCRAIAQINTGELLAGASALQQLHRDAEQRAILGTAPFCAFDRAVVLTACGEKLALDDALRRALEYDRSEPPSLWSMKLRALAAAGLHDEARALLRVLAPGDLRKLPCDSSWLGTLAHVARAALQIGALDYAKVAGELLAPYPDHFAAQVSFIAEGAVPHVRGMIAMATGRVDEGAALLEQGLSMNRRAGYALRVEEANKALERARLRTG